ncbi:MAG: mandelate racemase/muconate lactonizing enzyme family protein [Thermomicrobiales bacterium]
MSQPEPERIARVEAIVLKVPLPEGKTYWGKASWGSEEGSRVLPLSAEYPPPRRRRYIYSETIDCCLVRIETASGAVGWGEAKAPVGAEATARIVENLLGPIVTGANPLDIRVLWERMYLAMQVRGHTSGFWLEAIAGVDIALWDLAGRLLGQPIHQLLGGAFRDRVRVYASGLPGLYDGMDESALARLADLARGHVANGFTAMKMALGHGIEPDIRAVAAVREAIGQDVILFVDAAGVYDPQQAIKLGRMLERYDVGWFEMPIRTDNLPGYIQVATALDVPIALDALTTRAQARDYVGGGGVDVIQPDVCRAGGISESLKIAEAADLYGAACAPHVSIGSAVHFAATLQLALALPNLFIAEHWIGDNPIGDQILTKPMPAPVEGYVSAPSGNGLGIEVDEAAVRRLAQLAEQSSGVFSLA